MSDVPSEGSVAQWQRALEEKALQARVLRLDAELAEGAAGELIGELEALTSQHPFEERIWSQLMLAQYRSGRQADALAAYQRARRLLAEEMGLQPSEHLTRLQQRILKQDETLSGPASTATVTAAPKSNLPHPVTRLIGRERELESLTQLMADPAVRLVTLPQRVGSERRVC